VRLQPRWIPLLAVALAAALACPEARAVTVDGKLDPEYGPPLSVQTTQTSTLDNTLVIAGADSAASGFGSELDAASGFVEGGVLHLFLAGNLLANLGETDHRDQLHLYFDTTPGGQNRLRADNPAVGFAPEGALSAFAGLTFDPGFAPDYWLDVLLPPSTTPAIGAYYATLPAGGGGVGAFLGTGTVPGTGALSGGDNSAGILVCADDRNVGGVGSGCGPGDGSGVTRGMECAIPLSAIGNPTGAIRICAFVSSVYNPFLFNQVLGSLPPGTCGLGAPAGVDFGVYPGDQFFTVPYGATPAHPASWGKVKATYR